MDVTPFVFWEVEESAKRTGLKLLAKEPVVNFYEDYNGYRPVIGARRICPGAPWVLRLPQDRIPFKSLRSVKHFRFIRAAAPPATSRLATRIVGGG